MPSPSDERKLRLQKVVGDYLDSLREKNAVSQEDICDANPDLMPELRNKLAIAWRVHQACQEAKYLDDDAGELTPRDRADLDRIEFETPSNPIVTYRWEEDWIPGYRIQVPSRIWGKLLGGQGTVYRAIQLSTQRRVAIKIPNHTEDQSSLLRFEREIEIIRSLGHDNIVKIIDWGFTQRGAPYYAMELIDGALHIDDFVHGRDRIDVDVRPKLSIEETLDLFTQVCDAVMHAHLNGVIHRDLKPPNILVQMRKVSSVNDDVRWRPVVKVVDFGLAKSEVSAAVTLDSNVLLGTLHYMAPEQVTIGRGPVDAQTDVYSLCVVLYQLLTGHLPYKSDPNDVDKLRLEIGVGPVCPPRKVWTPESGLFSERFRLISRRCSINRDLETVLMKGLRLDKDRRYPSVRALRDDILRCRHDQPIEASPESGWYECVQFVSRHRRAVTVAAAFVLLITISALYFYHQNVQKDQLLKQKQQLVEDLQKQKNATEGQRNIADRRFEEVRRLAHSFVFDSHELIEDLPGATPAREFLVKTATTYLDGLASERIDDLALQRELAFAYLKIGDVEGCPDTPNLGHTGPALECYQKGHGVFEYLAGQEPESTQALTDLSVSHHKIGRILAVMGKTSDALGHLERCLQIQEKILELVPDSHSAHRDISVILNDIGDLKLQLGDSTEAICLHEQSLDIRRQLAQESPEDLTASRDVAACLFRIGHVYLIRGAVEAAELSFSESLGIFQDLANSLPNSARAKRDLVMGNIKLGDVSMECRHAAAAISSFEVGLELAEQLAAADPSSARAQRDWSMCCERLGNALFRQGQTLRASELYNQALTIQRRRVRNDPHSLAAKQDLSVTLNHVGNIQESMGHLPNAMESYRESLKIRKELVDADSENATRKRDLAMSFRVLGDLHLRQGAFTEALKNFHASLDIREALIEMDPGSVRGQREAAIAYERVGSTLARTDSNEGLKYVVRALSILEGLDESAQASVQVRRELALCLQRLGKLQLQLGAPTDAISTLTRCIEIQSCLVSQVRNEAQAMRDLAVGYIDASNAMMIAGKHSDALLVRLRSLSMMHQLSEVDPTNADAQRDLGQCHLGVGDILVRLRRYEEALEQFETGLAICERLDVLENKGGRSQRDLANSLERLGMTLAKLECHHRSRAAFERSRAIREALVEMNRDDARAAQDLAICYEHIGIASEKMRDLDEARWYHEKALTIREHLAAANPSSAEAWFQVSISHENLGGVFQELGLPVDALASFEGAVNIREQLFSADGNNVDILRSLCTTLAAMGAVFDGMANDTTSPTTVRRARYQDTRRCFDGVIKGMTMLKERGMNAELANQLIQGCRTLVTKCERTIAMLDEEAL